MTVSTGTPKSFTRDDLRVLDLLDHPIWVFDIVNKSMWWGNTLAVEYWNATSLDDLISRNFKDDMSDAVHKKNLDTLERLRRNERVSESVRLHISLCCREGKGGKTLPVRWMVEWMPGARFEDFSLLLCDIFYSRFNSK